MVKYLLTLVFCAACMAVLLSGCGGGSSDEEDQTATTLPVSCAASGACH
jgi:hypothetical protein